MIPTHKAGNATAACTLLTRTYGDTGSMFHKIAGIVVRTRTGTRQKHHPHLGD